jgi:hypothetical protein
MLPMRRSEVGKVEDGINFFLLNLLYVCLSKLFVNRMNYISIPHRLFMVEDLAYYI